MIPNAPETEKSSMRERNTKALEEKEEDIV